MLVSSITSLLFFLYTPVISILPTISRALLGEPLPIPIRAVPPPIKYRLFFTSVLLPICVIGVVATVDLTRRLFEISTVVVVNPLLAVINCDALIVVVDIPPLAVNAPVILVSPTTSRETVGLALPIPTRAYPPPTKYKFFSALTFFPY